MRLAIFGGTGRVGRCLLDYAARDGLRVRALVRDPAKLPAAPGIALVTGDVTDPAAVQHTLDGTETVLSVLGGGGLANPGTTLSDGICQIVTGMERLGIRRVLAVAGSGVLDNPAGGLRAEAPGFPEIYAAITRQHLATFEALRKSALDWTLVCCPDLLDGKLTGRYRVSADLLPEDGTSISVQDTADFMLRQVSLNPFIRRRVGLAY